MRRIGVLLKAVFVLVLKLEVTDESKRITSTPTSAPPPNDNDTWDFDLQRKTEMSILEEIESLEERICSASLQTKVQSLQLVIIDSCYITAQQWQVIQSSTINMLIVTTIKMTISSPNCVIRPDIHDNISGVNIF